MPRKKKNSKSRKKQPPRRLSGASAQRLGFEHRCLAEADKVSGLVSNLAKYFERHPRIRAAFERGRLLRYLVELAPVATIHDAAKRLKDLRLGGFERGQDLRDFLDSDPEANELWETARVNGWIEVRKSLSDAARAGNAKAIAMMEQWALDRQREGGEAGAVQFSRLNVAQMVELFGVSRQSLHEWTVARGLPRNMDGTYDLAAAIKWFEDFTSKKAVRGKDAVSADKLRDLKAEEKALDLAQRRGELLDRQEVIAGLVARWQNLVNSFAAKQRELARMLHGQTIEHIVDILERWFEDLQRGQLELPAFLELPEEAAAKLAECLELLKESEKSDG